MKNILAGTFNRIPAPLLVILGIVSTNAGAALSKPLFDSLGVIGTVSLQFTFGAIILLAITKPKIHKLPLRILLLVVLNGATLCALDAFYFQTVAHLPLGVAVTIGFCGPLFLALIGSRTLLDGVWLLLAGIGLFMITPFQDFQQGASLIGYMYAVLYALGLCLYIVTSKFLCNATKNSKGGTSLEGLQGLAAAMAVSAIIIMPFGIADSGAKLLNPTFLANAFGLAIITMVLTYAFQYTAISKLSTKSFGILSSSRPIVAAVLGVIILGDTINLEQVFSFSLIIAASIGAIVFQQKSTSTIKTPLSNNKATGIKSVSNKTTSIKTARQGVKRPTLTKPFV